MVYLELNVKDLLKRAANPREVFVRIEVQISKRCGAIT